MAFRLIFTSAPRALSGSRTGFCTVARSSGMSEKLAAAVEKCGAYEHDKMRGHPVFSHRKLMFANSVYHVLTRLSDAGADYTNRSNYIADHIVLSQDEAALLPSPAQAMLQRDDWHESWDSEPRWLGDVKISGQDQAYAPPSRRWREAFGDEGAAALLLGDPPAIFASPGDGKRLLELFAESSALLPDPARAWDYAFTTSLGRGEQPSDYSWRAEVSPSADRMASLPGAVNLVSMSAPAAPDTPAARYARTAKMTNRERLGLKAASFSEFRPQLHIAKPPRPKARTGLPAWALAAAAAVSAAAVLVGIWALAGGGEGGQTQIPPPAGTRPPEIDYSRARTFPETYSSVRAKVKAALAAQNWADALSIWDGSGLDGYNPAARAEILGDIAMRADALMDEADKTLSSEQSDDGAEPAAVAKMASARSALEIADIPNRGERLRRWKTIEKKIKKL